MSTYHTLPVLMMDSAKPAPEHPEIECRPTIMTLEEVAGYLRVHRFTLYRLVRDGTIPSTKVANQWRFKKARIDEWLLGQMAPSE